MSRLMFYLGSKEPASFRRRVSLFSSIRWAPLWKSGCACWVRLRNFLRGMDWGGVR